MSARSKRATALLAIVLVALATSGCGRRGSLLPPGTDPETGAAVGPASAATGGAPRGYNFSGGAVPDSDAVRAGDELADNATPAGNPSGSLQTSKGAKRGYTVPKEPFILDPIL